MKILLLGVMLFFSTIASAEKYEEPKTVELTTNSEKLQQGPRTPIHIPIDCVYSYGTLAFSFFENLGYINVSVINSTTGLIETDIIDTSCGGITINVSSSSGEYIIIIDAQTESYYGYYSIN